jgi:hypothetical protein
LAGQRHCSLSGQRLSRRTTAVCVVLIHMAVIRGVARRKVRRSGAVARSGPGLRSPPKAGEVGSGGSDAIFLAYVAPPPAWRPVGPIHNSPVLLAVGWNAHASLDTYRRRVRSVGMPANTRTVWRRNFPLSSKACCPDGEYPCHAGGRCVLAERPISYGRKGTATWVK